MRHCAAGCWLLAVLLLLLELVLVLLGACTRCSPPRLRPTEKGCVLAGLAACLPGAEECDEVMEEYSEARARVR